MILSIFLKREKYMINIKKHNLYELLKKEFIRFNDTQNVRLFHYLERQILKA